MSTSTTTKEPRRVALVTGAGRNIGRAIALALARQGLAVVVNVRSSMGEGQAVVDELQALGTPALLCVADVTDAAAVHAMVCQIAQHFGRLDVLVNNAAIRQEAPLADITPEDWRGTLAVVLDGAFHCTQAALPWLQKSEEGAVINIGGMTAHTGALNRIHVVTAKAGLVGLTRYLATYWADKGVRANALSPGGVYNGQGEEFVHRLTALIPMGRMATKDEYRATIQYLCSDASAYMNGQNVVMDGGRSTW